MKILSQVSQYSDLTTGYVYKWTNLITGELYIGSTCGNNPKYIGSGTAFLIDVKKYGIKNFYRTILYIGPKYCEVEEELLIFFDAENHKNFYNLKNTANGMSSKTREKIRIAGLNRFVSLETREKHRKAQLGVKLSEETKKKISEKAVGRISPNKGKILPEKTKNKLSQSAKNQQKYKCSYCEIITTKANISRWHDENCKLKLRVTPN